MSLPKPLPSVIVSILEEKGVSEKDILFSLKTDTDIDYHYTDVYLLATRDALCVLSGNVVVHPSGKKLGNKTPTLSYREYGYAEYELKKLENPDAVKDITSGLLVADYEGEHVALARFSMAMQNGAYTFLDNLRALLEKGDLSPDEIKQDDELYCPTCGGRYIDPKRKICPKCMDKTKLIKRLSVFFLRYKGFMALSLLCLVVTTVLAAVLPYVKGSVLYDDVLEVGGKYYGQLLYVVLLIVGTKLLSVVASTINGVITARIAAKVVYDIKTTVFSAITRLSYGFFTSRQTGGLMTSVNGDANSIYSFFCDGLPYLLINIIQFIAVTVIMIRIDPLLTLAALITVPLFLFLYRKILLLFDKMYAKNYSRRRSFNSLITDILSGIRVVKAFAREDDEKMRFDKKSAAYADTAKTIGLLNSSVFPLIGFALYIGTFIVWGYGGWQVMQGEMKLGTLMTFIGYMGLIYSPLGFFSEVSRWWAECINAISRVFEILDSIPEVAESEHPTPLPECRGEITFSHVSFGYDKTRKILSDIDFSIKPGETVGIVGETGAGKSTLVNLLIRLYDTEEGNIFIDGINVRDLSFRDLHAGVAIVSQETYLFAGTIMENIRYARPEATDEEVMEAAKMADAHRFIVKYPDAYETRVGRGYKSLSGGERQRISIARAILKDPKILILDEATSAMDTGTERRIQRALGILSKGRTTIMIAHRLSTLRDADRIVVIDDGKMPEYGTHRELLALRGVYYNLYRMQAEALRSIGIE